MPAFVKTPKDETRWRLAKKMVARGMREGKFKGMTKGSDRYWSAVNGAYHYLKNREK
jgi:hypothetical protein